MIHYYMHLMPAGATISPPIRNGIDPDYALLRQFVLDVEFVPDNEHLVHLGLDPTTMTLKQLDWSAQQRQLIVDTAEEVELTEDDDDDDEA